MPFVKRLIASDYIPLLLCVVVAAFALATTPGFGSGRNATNLIAAAGPLMVLALAQMLVMISGGIDLSLTAIMAIVSVTAAWLMSATGAAASLGGLAIPLALISAIAMGCLLGSVSGWLVARLDVPPFIATLTMMMILYGLATWVTQSRNIGSLPSSFCNGLSNPWVISAATVALACLVSAILRRSIVGHWLYAVGRNAETARVSGVPVVRLRWAVYAVAGGLAAVASLLYTAQIESGSPVLGKVLLLDVIGAVVLGGTSLFGGRGKVSWTAGGVLFLTLLDNVLNLQSIPYAVVMMAKGALIFLAALLDSIRHRWRLQS